MEAVKTFNSELYSLNDYKPPISKAKMTQITKAAIKAIKFYKHVVQSVEKFIQKIYLFIICKYTVAVFRHSRRGRQIPLQMFVGHHVVAGI